MKPVLDEGFVWRVVRGVDEVVAQWPFFAEGLTALNEPIAMPEQVTTETWMQALVESASTAESEALVAMTLNKNLRPLAFIVLFNNTSRYSKRKSALVYAIYSNRLNKHAARWTLMMAERWARQHGYQELHGYNAKVNSHGIRMCEWVFGFKRQKVFFTKSL